ASMIGFVFCGVACILLPLVFGAASRVTIIGAGVSGLMLLVAHVLVLTFDVSDIAADTIFTWQSHVAATVLVGVVGLGTIMPLRQDTVLVAVFGTMGAFVAVGIVGALWVFL